MFCPNCGSLNDDQSKFCQNCGRKLITDSNNESYVQNASNVQQNVPVYQNLQANQNNGYINNQVNGSYANVPTFSSAHSIALMIISMLCCGNVLALIFAILSLVEGNKVAQLVASGNVNAARVSKEQSSKWLRMSYIFLAIEIALIFAYVIFAVVVTSAYAPY